MNLFVRQKETHRYRDQTYNGQGRGRRKDWEFGISTCKLFYIDRQEDPTV